MPFPVPLNEQERLAALRNFNILDVERVRTKILGELNRGNSNEMEFRVVNNDATIKLVHLISTPVTDPQGKLIRRRGTFQDITERKQASERIRESERLFHSEQLKRLEQQRLVEQQQTQLQTLREVTLKLMDKINNPLAIILMMFELWQRDNRLSAEMLKNFEMIRTAAFRISNALQEVSKVERCKTLDTSFGTVLDIHSKNAELQETVTT